MSLFKPKKISMMGNAVMVMNMYLRYSMVMMLILITNMHMSTFVLLPGCSSTNKQPPS